MHGLKALAIWITVAFALFVAVIITVDRVVTVQSSPRIVEISQVSTPDGIIVLGAGVKPDGSVSDMLKERLDKAFELHSFYPHVPVIVSGDGGAAHNNEPAHMKEYLVGRGVPASLIVEDPDGVNTRATVEQATKTFRLKQPIYVSQEYHLYRTLFISLRLGQRACGVACDQQQFKGQAQRDVREVLARIKDYVVLEML